MNKIVCTLLLVCTFGAAQAQDPVLWTGGVGIEERESAPAGGTLLSFFLTSGHYLSQIEVTVTDESGREIVHTTTEGPWLVLDLEPGTYDVVARRRTGHVESQRIEVAGENQTFGFAFPA